MRLFPRSVADFYAEYMDCLRSFGIGAKINLKPQEFDDNTPFDEDQHHVSYDREAVDRFHRVLTNADRVLKVFRGRFLGKCSPVHFFWGSMDLAVTRFSGRVNPQSEKMDRMMAEAYSHEVISCGFWPGDRKFQRPAFYAYALPRPDGLENGPLWNPQLGEFILDYETLRYDEDPGARVLDFCQSTYEAAAGLAQWDRPALEYSSQLLR